MDLEIPNLDNPAERKKLVRALNIFRKLRKVSRTRAQKLFARTQEGVKEAVIIIGQEIDAEETKYVLGLFKKAFPDAPKPEITINPALLGGVRLQYGDEMAELSLNQIKI